MNIIDYSELHLYTNQSKGTVHQTVKVWFSIMSIAHALQ